MNYIGDKLPGDVVNFKFLLINSSGGALVLTAMTFSVYKDDSVSDSTAGLTTTLTFDGRAGFTHVKITTATDPAFYTAGSDYFVTLIAQTPATPSLIGNVVGEFSLANRMPNLAQAEPVQGTPPESASPMTKLAYLYKSWRNIKKQTAAGWTLLGNDDTTVHHKTTVSDDGTTATKGKIISGP